MIGGRTLFIAALVAAVSAENLRGEEEVVAVRALAGSPTKSPSSGLHKPTWKPSSKPNEKHSTKSEVGAALPRKLEDKLQPPAGVAAKHPLVPEDTAGMPTKSPSAGLHKPTWKPSVKPNEQDEPVVDPSGPVLSTQMHDGAKVVRPAHQADEKDLEGRNGAAEAEKEGAPQPGAKGKAPRQLAGAPTKSPSSGLHKPTWKPSSKPNERRGLSSVMEKRSPGSHEPTMTPRTMEPTEGEQGTKPYHTSRSLAGSPSKSPSSGLHKPTWRPSSKPNEHRRLSGHHAKREAADEAKHADDPKFDKKEGKKIVEKKADQLEDKKSEIKASSGTKSSDEESRKAVKDTKSGKGFDSKASSKDAEDKDSRRLHGYTVIPNPTKSPSTGIRKPTWKPSSKPNEDRRLSEKHTEYHAVTTKKSKKAANEARSPGSHEPTMTPRTMEPTEAAQPQKPYHDARMLAGTPSKSPSSGLHKPTWKPSSKPNERRGLSKEHRQLSEDR